MDSGSPGDACEADAGIELGGINMKTRLAKFYRSLACRVALATIATASVAKAHDLPHHFPLAPTDWGMIQQDCMGHHDAQSLSLPSSNSTQARVIELTLAAPDQGSPPAPTPRNSTQHSHVASQSLVGSDLYDGVDCAQLESFYRLPLTADLVEYGPSNLSNIVAEEKLVVVAAHPELTADAWQFHKSFFAACSCDFESQQAAQIHFAPVFVFHSIRIADYFDDNFSVNALRPQSLVLRDLQLEQASAANWISPLAIAVPTQQLENEQRFADALATLATWDCMLQNELFQFSGMARVGKLTGEAVKGWYSSVLPTASNAIGGYAKSLKPVSPNFEKHPLAQRFSSSTPLFIIYPTAAGNEVAIPIAQARNFSVDPAASFSPEFKQFVASTHARLQWAGGRLSEAAAYMNGWFSERIARVRNHDLR